MHTMLSNLKYDCFETILHENIECPIDIEYSLPDYCPNIQKILKCIPQAHLTSYSFTQDKIICEGKLVLYIQYVDENSGSVRVCEIHKEFSHVGQINQNQYKIFGSVLATTGHIICRAINARKLDIHIPVVLNMTITAHKENNINCDATGLEKKTEKIQVSHAVGHNNFIFTLEQELEISKSLPPIENVHRDSVAINNIKTTVNSGKIQMEAIADIAIIYSTAENVIEKMQYSIPFSQSFDVTNADEECIICHDIKPCEYSVQPKEDENGECTLCDLYIKISADLSIYKDKELAVITDAYSIDKLCDFKYQNMTLSHIEHVLDEKINLKKTVFLADDEMEKMVDAWCDEYAITAYCEKDKITFRGKFDITMEYIGKSSQVFCVTKNFDFSTTKEFKELYQRKCNCEISVSIKDYRIVDGNNIEFTCEANINAVDFKYYYIDMLQDVIAQENIENIENNSIKVYYSHVGESLWDIGKIHHCPIQAIVENNNLTDVNLASGQPLLIF